MSGLRKRTNTQYYWGGKGGCVEEYEPEGNRKEVTRGDQLSGILNKDNKREKRNEETP
jgi:hypothetical protein